MHAQALESPVYCLLAEFDDPEELVIAAHKTREAGYKKIDGFSPFPVHGLAEAIGFSDWRIPWAIFFGGLVGAAVGFGLQSWVSAIAYPLNVGGRPLIPWPTFIPVTFECTVLLASFAAVGAALGLSGLPRPHHPLFNSARFEYASQDRFFLSIEATDPKFDADQTARFLEELGPVAVEEVRG